MNYEATISFLKQRMREMGIPARSYHYEPITITGTPPEQIAQRIIIKSYNQYYYLVNGRDLSGVQIVSDSGYFNSDEPFRNSLPEFTGDIEISSTGISAWHIGDVYPDGSYSRIRAIEFVRVTIH